MMRTTVYGVYRRLDGKMERKPLNVYYSRSAVTTDWNCARKRYWNYEYAGKGLTPNQTFLELHLGTTVHDGLAAIAGGVGIDAIIDAARNQFVPLLLQEHPNIEEESFAEEQMALVEGMLRGFHKHTWPLLQQQFPQVVCIEREFVYEHDSPIGPLKFLSKPDLIVRDKEGCLHYIEYKTTSSTKEQWMNSWSTAVQLHSSILTVEAELGEEVMSVIVQGINKGYASYGKQNSPFCYIYHKPAEPPFKKAEWAYEYRYGLKKYPTWQMDGGVKKVVEGMPTEILSQQFPQVPPIFINRDLVEAFFRQRALREADIKQIGLTLTDERLDPDFRTSLLDRTFPQNFEACMQGWGKPCNYKNLCHGNVSNPLEAGYVMRESHHDLERVALEGV